ncbi:MAG: adenylyltransferase/cytidyltransferase family protein, partial [Candidatus Bathyarchaeia archaeon]
MMRVVLTGGFFDPPHRGHISLFREAKALGDRLVVLVHRDECCHTKQGYSFLPLEHGPDILGSVKYLDEVIICPAPRNL